ncbi:MULTISPECIES: MarR family winged helix-turn-helix transcriptional regulator [Actinoalloteichus]|uniref:Transcriptional regulator n=1 Tax=Actinoalloteichus fjordicus TaxID=1612552 RepID=A0AAC9L8L7_9PSEU|nr:MULTISPECIES: MarR family winged helix-turn-helix transcriptional regulator [Actinoalloteichus]APU13183.1 transcriptional regulator [Actinoalloteichus fjordicus]APU19134.1 transcriptional regulator [Actinoalloteichus sp. GBA129-24]
MTESPTSAPPAPLPQLISGLFDWVAAGLAAHLSSQGFTDLRPTHVVNVLRHLDCGGTRPTVLADRAGMTPQAISELVAHLERAGYVRRVPDPSDGRARIVVYADRGEAAGDAAARYFAELETHGARLVGAQRFDDVKTALEQILSSGHVDATGSTT